ncbi:MAG TPA: DinB family protein [Thermoanaerobaculia bacterium]|jgi:hypothetical protein|nr:DinB family protein [Thermoanaerobaculia bacterium]
MNDAVLRENLVELLTGGHAHVAPEKALESVDSSLRNVRPLGALHSVWEELEHMRLAQEDILRYTLDPNWKSPEFPKGYWPSGDETFSAALWSVSVGDFLSDLGEVVTLVKNPEIDLTSAIPHGEGRTYLREILLVADHNAYHLGQIVQTRKLLGDWK